MANSRRMKIEILRLCNLHLHEKSRIIGNNAGYGIRTRELLRDGILSPAPLASLANPALNFAWPFPPAKYGRGPSIELVCFWNKYFPETAMLGDLPCQRRPGYKKQTLGQAKDICPSLKLPSGQSSCKKKKRCRGRTCLPHALKHPALSIQGFNWEENPARRWQ